MNIKEKLSVLGNVFLTHREMSTDEAIYRFLSIPLKESNRKKYFLAYRTARTKNKTSQVQKRARVIAR